MRFYMQATPLQIWLIISKEKFKMLELAQNKHF